MKTNRKIVIKGVRDFDSEQTFDCGQCFRWRKLNDGSWIGLAGDRGAHVLTEECEDGSRNLTIIEFAGPDFDKKEAKAFWEHYLDLSRDYSGIKRKLSRGDRKMKEATKCGGGIHILNQDLWEMILSFIISQNNNIPRIKGCIERLADCAGRPLKNIDKEYLSGVLDKGGATAAKGGAAEVDLVLKALPSPKKLAAMNVEDLASVRLGYRAKYLIEASKEVQEKGMPGTYDEVLALTGVGPKVANCIGLFGLHETDSFPIDVWVKRVMNELYDFNESDLKGMEAYADEHFGELSGFAQQYLFYYIRKLHEN